MSICKTELIARIAIGEARLWRDQEFGAPQSEQGASWFSVLNMPEGTAADLFWIFGQEWGFLYRGGGSSYISAGIYPTKEAALEGLKEWFRAKETDVAFS